MQVPHIISIMTKVVGNEAAKTGLSWPGILRGLTAVLKNLIDAKRPRNSEMMAWKRKKLRQRKPFRHVTENPIYV